MLETAILCLALNIYHEARGEPIVGQRAVAQVTMNRAGGDPEKVCSEVFKPKQFSWANTLTDPAKAGERSENARKFLPTDNEAWGIAKRISRNFLTGSSKDVVGSADHYFNPKKLRRKPRWSKSMTFVAKVGDHYFYASR